MKYLFHILLLTWAFFPITAYGESCTKIKATAHPAYPPYHWRSDNEIVGASIEITRKILNEIGVELETQYLGPWKRVLNHAKNNQVDLIIGLKKTQERERYLTFSTSPLLPNPFSVFVRLSDDANAMTKLSDLKKKTGGKNAGDRFGEPFDSFARTELSLQSAKSSEINVQKLLQGRIDYYIHGRYVGRAQLSHMPGGLKVKALDLDVSKGFIHSGFTKASSCTHHLAYLSKRYEEMLNSGEAVDILNQHLAKWGSTQIDTPVIDVGKRAF